MLLQESISNSIPPNLSLFVFTPRTRPQRVNSLSEPGIQGETAVHADAPAGGTVVGVRGSMHTHIKDGIYVSI